MNFTFGFHSDRETKWMDGRRGHLKHPGFSTGLPLAGPLVFAAKAAPLMGDP